MERPLKNRVSSLLALLTACQLGLGAARAEETAAPADTTLTVEALRRRGAELDNFIYEASDVPAASGKKESPQPGTRSLHRRTLWIAAGAACLLGIGTAWILSSPEKKVTYTDYGY